MRRVVSLWLPQWTIERLRRSEGPHTRPARRTIAAGKPDSPSVGAAAPFALVAAQNGRLCLTAVNRAARHEGLVAGQTLADARAIAPHLTTRPAEPEADARALRALADWCRRYTPWTSPEGTDGLWLDISGCAHLFGGETSLLYDLLHRLKQQGLSAQAGLADTPGAAWALARFMPETARLEARIADPGDTRQALSDLPVAALRLPPDAVLLLHRLGLRTIASLYPLPRASLARRFRATEDGVAVLRRLDQALGREEEPLSPLTPVTAYRERLDFADPLLTAQGVEQGLDRLLGYLCARLVKTGYGARGLCLSAYRTDGGVSRAGIATGRTEQTASHFRRLFQDRLDRIDPGFGIDALVLEAEHLSPMQPRQTTLQSGGQAQESDAVSRLTDRLTGRLGASAVHRLVPGASHRPERAEHHLPTSDTPTPGLWQDPDHKGPARPRRPIKLLPRPEAVKVLAEVPEGPPLRFTWRRAGHRTVRAEGPERIAPEWWLEAGADPGRLRDYYHVEDDQGRRFWLFREGLYQLSQTDGPPRWFIHGLFA
ncbi:MAG: DNA polymerase Y family protein [Alphaproteobacteria bacterium]